MEWCCRISRCLSVVMAANFKVPCSSFVVHISVLKLLVIVLFSSHSSLSSKILFFNSKGEGSHYTTATALGEELASRGHSITFLLADVYKHRTEHPVHSKLFNFKLVKTYDSFGTECDECMEEGFQAALEGRNLLFEYDILEKVMDLNVRYCEMIFNQQTDLLSSLLDEHFDLVIFDPVWPCATGVSEYLSDKRIVFLPTSLMPHMLRQLNIPINPATTSDMGLGFSSKMNFVERTANFVFVILGLLTGPSLEWPYRSLMEPYGIKPSTSSLPKVDFVITATDSLIDKTIPMYPSHVAVGGISIQPSQHVLSQDLEEFMQSSSDHGVIVFSLGSYTTHLPEHIIMAYQTAFAKLPQKVIWQWKNKTPPNNLPSNVKTLPWLPQNDLLGHNKTKLFIYHGGNNGLYEAIYHGVPIIVMPILLDQFDVAQNVFEKEVGLKIMISELSSERVSQVIEEVLTNNKYRDNMKRLSTMFRDRPQSPRERAAFWVEHVLKYGSEHLRTPGHDMSFIQYYLIDVISFLFLSVTIVLFLFYLAIKYSIKGICLLCALTRKLKRE